MSAWTAEELEKIAEADELELAPTRRDGSLGKPVTIWVVRHGDHLYVRSAYGRSSAWFRATQQRHEGRIHAGGVAREVRFVEAGEEVSEAIDAAYRTKYQDYAARYVTPMVSPPARAATLQLVPRAEHLGRAAAR